MCVNLVGVWRGSVVLGRQAEPD